MHVGDLPRRNAFRYPHQLAWKSETGSWTWSEANRRINSLGNGLAKLGLRKGDRIGVLSQPTHQYAEIYFAAAKMGFVVVPLNWGLVTREIEFMLRDVEARALLVEDAGSATAAPALANLPELAHVIGIGPRHAFPYDYEDLVATADESEPEVDVDETELYAIRFTSGTTGLPKGCPFSHRQVLQRSVYFLAQIPHSHHDVALMVSPLYVGVGSSMLISYTMVGSGMVIHRRFDPEQVLTAIERERITTFVTAVPSLIDRLREHPTFQDRDLSSLRVVGYGGALFPLPMLRKAMEAFPCEFFGVYGQLESGGFTTYLLPEDHRLDGVTAEEKARKERRLSSCGREALQADVRIVGEDGHELPRGEVGELVIRSPGMVTEYWNRPGEIDKSLRRGWFHTGDGAWMDEDGYIYIADRIKDMVRTGGMNVYSAEVENVLREHPAVLDAAVVGLPDARWGEAVTAFVVIRPGQNCSREDLIDYCRTRLAAYKVPKHVEYLSALPMNSTGKVLKRELKEQYLSRN